MDDMASGWLWIGFSIFLFFALTLDAVIHRKSEKHHPNSIKVALIWTFVWISTALIFNALLWLYLYKNTNLLYANKKALDFFTGYIIEKSLSVDNLFAFYMVFTQFRIPKHSQQRIFSYGIWGAIIMRLIIILIGTWLVSKMHWLLYVMGIFLLLTGIRMFFVREDGKDITESFIIRFAKKCFRYTQELKGENFFIRQNGLLYVTPLFLALICIEFSDLIFALDSIPAIFAITQDPFIVWTSNIFAILGLRALYFVLVSMIESFHLLKYGIALILVFVGLKMVIEPWIHLSVLLSLCVIISIIIIFVGSSIHHRKRDANV